METRQKDIKRFNAFNDNVKTFLDDINKITDTYVANRTDQNRTSACGLIESKCAELIEEIRSIANRVTDSEVRNAVVTTINECMSFIIETGKNDIIKPIYVTVLVNTLEQIKFAINANVKA